MVITESDAIYQFVKIFVSNKEKTQKIASG